MPMKNPSHPGEIIKDCLESMKLNVTEVSTALGVTRTTLSRVLNGKAGVSPEMAVRLSKAIGSSVGFWLRLQLNYDLARIQEQASKIRVRRLGAARKLAWQD